MNNRRIASLLTLVLFFAGVVLYRAHKNTSPQPSALSAQVLDTTLQSFTPHPRTKTANCQVNGAYPDPACTPGAIFEGLSVEEMCVSGYTKAVRNVSVALKRQVYAEYGLSYPQPTGAYEADHFIPLELGGSNDIANLFPEAADPDPGFHEKDIVENYLHKEVCSGAMTLAAAQQAISTDWLAVYNTIPPEERDALRKQFSSFTKRSR